MVTVSFTGHRPPLLGGYNYSSPKNMVIKSRIKKALLDLLKEYGSLYGIAGGALGFDQMAVDVLYSLRDEGYQVKVEIAIPFAEQYTAWPIDSQRFYLNQLNAADVITHVDLLDGYRVNEAELGKYHKNKLFNRNTYMMEVADVVIAYCKNERSGTGHALRQAKRHGCDIIRVE